MRISALQKAVLIALYAIGERRRDNRPVPLMVLLDAVNSGRLNGGQSATADRNFRTSCHTLAKHGLLQKSRDMQSLQLYFSLTDAGAEKAQPLYENAVKEA